MAKYPTVHKTGPYNENHLHHMSINSAKAEKTMMAQEQRLRKNNHRTGRNARSVGAGNTKGREFSKKTWATNTAKRCYCRTSIAYTGSESS